MSKAQTRLDKITAEIQAAQDELHALSESWHEAVKADDDDTAHRIEAATSEINATVKRMQVKRRALVEQVEAEEAAAALVAGRALADEANEAHARMMEGYERADVLLRELEQIAHEFDQRYVLEWAAKVRSAKKRGVPVTDMPRTPPPNARDLMNRGFDASRRLAGACDDMMQQTVGLR